MVRKGLIPDVRLAQQTRHFCEDLDRSRESAVQLTNCEYHGDCVIECSHPRELCRLYQRTNDYNSQHTVELNPTEMMWAMVEAGELSDLDIETLKDHQR